MLLELKNELHESCAEQLPVPFKYSREKELIKTTINSYSQIY